MAYVKKTYGSNKKTAYKKPEIIRIPLGDINPSIQQSAFFQFIENGDGNGLLEALAGTGKTTTILHGTKYAKGTCLYLCFNSDIANSTKAKAPDGVEVSTLHSLGLKTITKSIGKYPTIDKHKTKNILVDKFNVPSEMISVAIQAVGICKNTLSLEREEIIKTLMDYDFTYESKEVKFEEYIDIIEKVLKISADIPQTVDFDDMLYIPVVKNYRFPSYDNIFGDEAQDFNMVQMEMIVRINAKRTFIVGDPNQAIYGFRGAAKGALHVLAERMNCVKFPLTVTYRCPKNIVSLATTAVAEYEAHESNEDGIVNDKTVNELITEAKEGDVIISRKNAPLVSLAFRFLAEKRRAFIRGREFGDALVAIIKKFKGNTMEELKDYILTWETKQIKKLNDKFGTEANLSQINDKADCLRAFIADSNSANEVIESIKNLFSDLNDQNAITLTSCHRAKGLEYDNVWMINSTFSFTSEEEKNLWYVAVTRTKKVLNIVHGDIKQKDIVEF